MEYLPKDPSSNLGNKLLAALQTHFVLLTFPVSLALAMTTGLNFMCHIPLFYWQFHQSTDSLGIPKS
jgi:hypothetical protein